MLGSIDDTPIVLRRVVYAQAMQRRIIERAVGIWSRGVPATATGDQRSPELSARCVTALAIALATLIPQMKHPLFQEEREWRLVYTSYMTPDVVRFRQSGAAIVPYINVDLTSQSGPRAGRIPLERITHAPAPEPDVRKRALRELLNAKGYPDSDVSIEGSDIPLRSA